MGLLSARSHAWLDWAAAAVFASAPLVIGFTGGPAKICWLVAAAHLFGALSYATSRGARPPPATLHGVVEGLSALLLLAVPWLFPLRDDAARFFLATGLLLGVAWLISDYRSPAGAHSDRTRAPGGAATPAARREPAAGRPPIRVVRQQHPPAV